MIQPEVVTAGVRIVRAEEAWEPVLFGGMIPIVGAVGVLWLIRWAIKEPPEHNKDLPPEDGEPPPPDPADESHEGPLS
ncbi:MAG TPA: hypothetical protein VMF55_10915 [Solirubrobacterales bacterium]|nr:hypothetical protein [Solirubrobacterales bacterium]